MARLIPGFGAYALEFTLICQVASFVDHYFVQHELRKRILRRLRAEGIEIPVPVRAIELRDGSAAPGAGAAGGTGTRRRWVRGALLRGRAGGGAAGPLHSLCAS